MCTLVFTSYTSDQLRAKIVYCHKTIFCFQNHQALQSLHIAKEYLMCIHIRFLKDSSPTEVDFYFYFLHSHYFNDEKKYNHMIAWLFICNWREKAVLGPWMTYQKGVQVVSDCFQFLRNCQRLLVPKLKSLLCRLQPVCQFIWFTLIPVKMFKEN